MGEDLLSDLRMLTGSLMALALVLAMSVPRLGCDTDELFFCNFLVAITSSTCAFLRECKQDCCVSQKLISCYSCTSNKDSYVCHGEPSGLVERSV